VLLLGVGHDANTTIHLAESLTGVRYRRKKYVTVVKEGKQTRIDYQEIDHCCQNFNLVDRWLEEGGFQRKGHVGHAEARLARSRDIVTVVSEQLKMNETVFLHPKGVDVECDEARDSLTAMELTSALPLDSNQSGPTNLKAIRCYEKVGFSKVGIVDTSDGPALLMFIERNRKTATI
jgi:hypothetical protein